MRRSNLLIIVGLAVANLLLLGACQVPRIQLFGSGEQGISLAVGDEVSLAFFTNYMNFDTGVTLDAGADYAFRIAILSHWVDADIDTNQAGEPLDERGFSNSLMPFEWAGSLRRSRNHNWFELMLRQSDCPRESLAGVSDLDFDAESGSYRFLARCSGKLALFVNDSYGFYGNNAGYANILLTRLN